MDKAEIRKTLADQGFDAGTIDQIMVAVSQMESNPAIMQMIDNLVATMNTQQPPKRREAKNWLK